MRPPSESPLVSVIIPTYRRADLVVRTVQSVLDQQHGDLEVIVSDDASPDDTVARLQTVRDPRLRLHAQPQNVGVWTNWTTAIRMARGRFIAFLGDDDLLSPDFLRVHLETFGRHPEAGAVFCRMEDCTADGCVRQVFQPGIRPGTLGDGVSILRGLFGGELFFGAGLFRMEPTRTVWERTEPDGWVADWGMLMRLALIPGFKAAACEGPLYTKLAHSDRLSTKAVKVTEAMVAACERALPEAVEPAHADLIRSQACNERVTLARHHASWGDFPACRRELWACVRRYPAFGIAWRQLIQAYLFTGRLQASARTQRGLPART